MELEHDLGNPGNPHDLRPSDPNPDHGSHPRSSARSRPRNRTSPNPRRQVPDAATIASSRSALTGGPPGSPRRDRRARRTRGRARRAQRRSRGRCPSPGRRRNPRPAGARQVRASRLPDGHSLRPPSARPRRENPRDRNSTRLPSTTLSRSRGRRPPIYHLSTGTYRASRLTPRTPPARQRALGCVSWHSRPHRQEFARVAATSPNKTRPRVPGLPSTRTRGAS